MFAQAHARPIRGAVATLGVSDRVAFLRRTYAHLGGALLAFTVLTAAFLRTETSLRWSIEASRGSWSLLLILVAFVGVSMVAQRLAFSQSSRALQYVGLGASVVLWAVIAQPLLWRVYFASKSAADFNQLVVNAALITGAIFLGLTATVFVTRKDFSFLRGALVIGVFASMGIVLASILFGFQLGALYFGAMILLMAGYILYETSVILSRFPPQAHVGAALLLFTSVANLFLYVLRFLSEINRR